MLHTYRTLLTINAANPRSHYFLLHINMPTKKVTCTKSKPVLLTVYVERQKRRPSSSSTHPQPYIHQTNIIKREVIQYRHGAGGQGYISRRAELLQYSQRLRLSARSSAPPASKPFYQKHNHAKSPQPPAKIVNVRRKPKNWIFPSCLGCTSFQAKKERKTRKKGSGTTSDKIKSAIKSLKGQKKQGFFSKLVTTSTKRK